MTNFLYAWRKAIFGITFVLFIVAVAIVAGFVEVRTSVGPAMSAERLGRIGDFFAGYVQRKQLPGVVTLVSRRGELVYSSVSGYADVEKATPLRRDSIFRIYSMSKPITGVAVMILFEEGKLLLTDPVSKFIPAFAGTRVLAGEGSEGGELQTRKAARAISIHHLLTHTAGLSYDFMGSGPVQELYKERGLIPYYAQDANGELLDRRHDGVCKFAEAVAQAPLVAHPGDIWHYSVAMDVLGCVVERASGMAFDDFLQQRLFEPLGMDDTGFQVSADDVHRFTVLYERQYKGEPLMERRDGADESSPFTQPSRLHDGGSGLVSTADDYMKFARMLLRGGEYGGKRILSRKTVQMITSNRLPASVIATANLGTESFQGLGFGITGAVVTDVALTRRAGSDGEYNWGGAASTIFWVDPEEEIAAVLMTQLLQRGPSYPLREQFGALVYQAVED